MFPLKSVTVIISQNRAVCCEMCERARKLTSLNKAAKVLSKIRRTATRLIRCLRQKTLVPFNVTGQVNYSAFYLVEKNVQAYAFTHECMHKVQHQCRCIMKCELPMSRCEVDSLSYSRYALIHGSKNAASIELADSAAIAVILLIQ